MPRRAFDFESFDRLGSFCILEEMLAAELGDFTLRPTCLYELAWLAFMVDILDISTGLLREPRFFGAMPLCSVPGDETRLFARPSAR